MVRTSSDAMARGTSGKVARGIAERGREFLRGFLACVVGLILISCGNADPTGWYAGSGTSPPGQAAEILGLRLRLVVQEKAATGTLFLAAPGGEELEMPFEKGSIVSQDIELSGTALGRSWVLRGDIRGETITGTLKVHSLLQNAELRVSLERVKDSSAAEEVSARGSAKRGTPQASPTKSDPERARETMTSMRSIAIAIESYAVDTNRYPNVGSLERLEPLISPTYIRRVPKNDGWNRPLDYAGNARQYEIRSLGADGQLDAQPHPGQNTSFDSDIVYHDGSFVQWPSGIQVH